MFPLDFSNHKIISLIFDKTKVKGFVISNRMTPCNCSGVLQTFTFAVSIYIVSL